MKNRMRRFAEIIIVVLVVIAAIYIRIVLLVNTDDFHGISAGKILLAKSIINRTLPWQWYPVVHPPVHLTMIIFGLNLYHNPLIISRLISLFFAGFSFFFYYYYVRGIFDSKTAFFSIVSVALYSEHIVYSVIGTPETMFHAMLFLGLFYWILFLEKGKSKFLYVSAIAIGIASLTRYEGLLFIPFILFFLRKQRKKAVLFFASAFLFPVIWMTLNYLFRGNAFLFLSTNDFNVPLQFNWMRSKGINIDFVYKLLFWPRIMMKTLGWPMFVSGIGGIILCLFKKKKMFPTMLFLVLFIIFILRTLQEKLYLQPRYSITLGLMLMPFSIFFALRIMKLINKRWLTWCVFLLIWTMIPCIGERVISAPLYAPNFAKNIAKYIKNNIIEDENIIMDHCGDERYKEPIKLLSGLNPRQFILKPYQVVKSGRWVADKEKFFEVVEEEKVRILIYSPLGDLGNVLGLEKKGSPAMIKGYSFDLQYENDPYFVYRLRKINDEL